MTDIIGTDIIKVSAYDCKHGIAGLSMFLNMETGQALKIPASVEGSDCHLFVLHTDPVTVRVPKKYQGIFKYQLLDESHTLYKDMKEMFKDAPIK